MESRELLDALHLKRLAENYALAVDTADADLFAAQFTEDGALEAPRGRFVGREQLRGVPPMMRERYRGTFHAVFNQVPSFTGDTAHAQTYCIARHFFAEEAKRHLCYEMTIRYLDEFARAGSGWLFSRRQLVVDAVRTFEIDVEKT
ncbi:nuclear transport factor 2 family protein [Terrarubrum flagellatum]|uniref:nuclear transport factor 2 family protein n=1 Tax=Terrirubrum flagellatum TaxID=2895980 RepID=UPI003144E735